MFYMLKLVNGYKQLSHQIFIYQYLSKLIKDLNRICIFQPNSFKMLTLTTNNHLKCKNYFLVSLDSILSLVNILKMFTVNWKNCKSSFMIAVLTANKTGQHKNKYTSGSLSAMCKTWRFNGKSHFVVWL